MYKILIQSESLTLSVTRELLVEVYAWAEILTRRVYVNAAKKTAAARKTTTKKATAAKTTAKKTTTKKTTKKAEE